MKDVMLFFTFDTEKLFAFAILIFLLASTVALLGALGGAAFCFYFIKNTRKAFWVSLFIGPVLGVLAVSITASLLAGGFMPILSPIIIALSTLITIPVCIVWRSSVESRRRNNRSSLLEDPPKCFTCGYNLTGNESGVCPECGTKIEPVEGGLHRW